MDVELTEEQALIRDSARAFAQEQIAPRAEAIDREGRIPAEVLQGLADLGLFGVNLPEALGGAEAGVVAYSLAMQEVSRACGSCGVTMAVTSMVGEVMAAGRSGCGAR
jgi:alkylation response protein AidB-like acyl-CoA dehydrogenase